MVVLKFNTKMLIITLLYLVRDSLISGTSRVLAGLAEIVKNNNLPCGGATSITSSRGLLNNADSVEVKLKSFNL